MPKFFVKNNQIKGENITILGEDVNHISNVLRAKIGDLINVCDVDTSSNYVVELTYFTKDYIEGVIKDRIESMAESEINIHIFQGIPKSDKMELIIQKSVELGVSFPSSVVNVTCLEGKT